MKLTVEEIETIELSQKGTSSTSYGCDDALRGF